MKPSLHLPIVEISISGETVQVRELRWPDAIALYERVASKYAKMAGGLNAELMVALLTESAEVCEWLIEKCCGKSKEWIAERSISEVMDLATEAAVLNVQVIFDRAKNIQRRLGPLLRPGAEEQRAASPQPSALNSSDLRPSEGLPSR